MRFCTVLLLNVVLAESSEGNVFVYGNGSHGLGPRATIS